MLFLGVSKGVSEWHQRRLEAVAGDTTASIFQLRQVERDEEVAEK